MLDEPMAGVNPALTQSLLGHVKSLRDEGMTRALRRARHGRGPRHQRLGDRHGRGPVIAEGPPAAISANPAVIDAYLGRAPRHCRPAGHARARRAETVIAESELGGQRHPPGTGAEGQPTDLQARRTSRDAVGRGDARRSSSASTTSWRATCPRSTSSTAADLDAARRRAHRHHRPQRRRQVTLLKAMFGLVTVRTAPCVSTARTSPA